MTFPAPATDRLLNLYLALGQYPILSGRIRARMRRELFDRGIITPQNFEAQARDTAIQSQHREGLTDPFGAEPSDLWELRLSRVREQLTDLIFSQNLSFRVFEELAKEVLGERGVKVEEMLLSMSPELAPLEMVFEQAMTIERLPAEERARLEPHLQESRVVLIRTLISDQLRYINIAKEWFTIQDLANIRRNKIGTGRIGGKAAGMLLAARILNELASPEIKSSLSTPPSFFLGSDVIYTFMSINNLFRWNDQKYKTEEEMRADYPQIVKDFQAGQFPPNILVQFQSLLAQVGLQPLIVRSSSLLEDNFGTSFAGKYDSIFLPNQDSPDQNLKNFTRAVASVYATTLNPTALLYRRSKGLQDYDERMGILIQVVQGEKQGRYYYPDAAGVAFSRNLYRWAPQIRPEAGFLRLVWGLGTRAVDRVGNDYPRLVALSHPLLRPSTTAKSIRRYSQQFVDVIDLETNEFKTLPVHDVLSAQYAPLRYVAQMNEDGDLMTLRSSLIEGDPHNLTITYDELLRRTPFAAQMRSMLEILENTYHSPVDMEFTLKVNMANSGRPELAISILQCRPQSHLVETSQVYLPAKLPDEDILFSTRFVVPQGSIDGINYVLFVPPEGYFALPTLEDRQKLRRTIGRLNAALAKETFICIGPGRWGSSNSDLGVPIDYGDIYHTRALVELSGHGIGPAPEPSLGTHFFQDLLESQIYPLALVMDDSETKFDRAFFYDSPNHVLDWIEAEPDMLDCLRLIRVQDAHPTCKLRVVMDDEKSLAVAFFVK